jgi:hypothetical protein
MRRNLTIYRFTDQLLFSRAAEVAGVASVTHVSFLCNHGFGEKGCGDNRADVVALKDFSPHLLFCCYSDRSITFKHWGTQLSPPLKRERLSAHS